jgi:hypothetical protein
VVLETGDKVCARGAPNIEEVYATYFVTGLNHIQLKVFKKEAISWDSTNYFMNVNNYIHPNTSHSP